MSEQERITVLLVDDEESFLDPLTVGLEREGFRVVTATDGLTALEKFELSDPDIVLLDVMLPGMSGLDVCRELRKRTQVPIIIVSAKSEEIDAVVGLEVGADDFVPKPYRMRELVARMRAVLRRTSEQGSSNAAAADLGDIRLDKDRFELTVRGEPVRLPLKEFELLSVLVDRVGHVVARQDIINRVWGYDYVGDTKTLDVHIKRLRSKLELDPANPTIIQTIRGLGYKLVPPAGAGSGVPADATVQAQFEAGHVAKRR